MLRKAVGNIFGGAPEPRAAPPEAPSDLRPQLEELRRIVASLSAELGGLRREVELLRAESRARPAEPAPLAAPEPAPPEEEPPPPPGEGLPLVPAAAEAAPSPASPSAQSPSERAAHTAVPGEAPRRRPSFTSGPASRRGWDAELRVAEDGVAYWGPIDNESSRAKAAGLKLIVDQHECIHCGTCVENTDAVFVLPDNAKAVAYRQEGPMDLIQDAIDACPVTCIHWTDEPDRFGRLNDADGRPLEGAAVGPS